MSWPSETFTMDDRFLYLDDNPDQTQEISHVEQQNVAQGVFGTMSSSTGTYDLSNLLPFLSDGNSEQEISHVGQQNVAQEMEISHVGEQNVDQEMVGLDISKSRPNGTFTPAYPSLFSVDNPNQEISRIGEQNVDKEMVGLVISKSSLIKQKKLRSDVWKMFEKCKDENGNDKAKCSLCEKKFDGSSKKGTTHLRNHFRSCQNKRNGGGASGSEDKPAGNSVTDQQLNHLDINQFNSCQNKRNEGGASGSGDKPAENSVTDQQLNHLDRVRTCIKQCYWDLPKQVWDDDIILVYNEEKEKLRIYFEKLCCRFSLSITNMPDGKYTSFWVHFIDDDWKLEEKIIGFKCIEGDQNMKVLKNVLSDLGIDNKISSMVTNGDSDIYVLSSDERENRLSGQGSLLSNCKFCVKDFYDVYETCTNFEEEMRPVLFNHMCKIFSYIIETSSKIGTFQMALGKEVIGTFQMALALGKEVTITEEVLEEMFWLDLVKIALGLKENFFELENMDRHFKSINLTKEQWDGVTKFVQLWHEDDAFDHFGDFDDFEPETANISFPILSRIYKKSRLFVTICDSFNCGKRYLQFVRDAEKCWEQSNLILAVAAVLDPRFKLNTVEHWYKEIYGDECETQRAIFMNYLISVYNEYANDTNNSQSSTSGSKEKKSSISYKMLDILGNSYDPDSGQSNNFELDLYLEHFKFPPIKEFDILEWWRGNSRYFPTLAKMACDFLSINITIPLDYMHLGILTYEGNFDSDIVKEAFVCTRNWLRN